MPETAIPKLSMTGIPTLATSVYTNPVQQTVATQVKKDAAAAIAKPKTSLLDILTGVGSVVGNILGQKNNPQPTNAGVQYMYMPQQEEEKKDKTIWYVLAAVTVIVVVVLVYFLMKNKTN